MGKKRFDRVRGSRAREIVSAVHYAAQNAPDKVFYSGDIIELKDGTQDVVKEKTSWGDYELEATEGYFSVHNLKLIRRA